MAVRGRPLPLNRILPVMVPRRRVPAVLAFAAALLLSPAAAMGQETAAATPPVLRPGDAIQVTVWRKPELSGEFDLADDGTVRHPLFQSIRVVDVPLAEVANRIRGVVAQYETSPQVVVVPLFRVAVAGEVNTPGLYTLAPEATVAHAVAAAGGVTPDGRMKAARLLRDGREMAVDLTQPTEGAAGMRIRSGDQILVPQSRWVAIRQYIAPAASILTNVLLILRTY